MRHLYVAKTIFKCKINSTLLNTTQITTKPTLKIILLLLYCKISHVTLKVYFEKVKSRLNSICTQIIY